MRQFRSLTWASEGVDGPAPRSSTRPTHKQHRAEERPSSSRGPVSSDGGSAPGELEIPVPSPARPERLPAHLPPFWGARHQPSLCHRHFTRRGSAFPAKASPKAQAAKPERAPRRCLSVCPPPSHASLASTPASRTVAVFNARGLLDKNRTNPTDVSQAPRLLTPRRPARSAAAEPGAP